MNYDGITKITAERISDYMIEAVNTDSIAVAEMFHNAAWGVRTLWFCHERCNSGSSATWVEENG